MPLEAKYSGLCYDDMIEGILLECLEREGAGIMFRNVRIGTRILIVILGIASISLLVISVISYTEMLNLTKYSQDANIELGITASDTKRAGSPFPGGGIPAENSLRTGSGYQCAA